MRRVMLGAVAAAMVAVSGCSAIGRQAFQQPVVRLQHQTRSKILGRETGVEMAENDLTNIIRADARMFKGFRRNLGDQAFERLALKLTEARMRPTDDACGHGGLLELRSLSRGRDCGRAN